MTNAITLSHRETLINSRHLETFGNLPKTQLYGFGVRGKHFVLLTKKNSCLSRIWFSFLKFLGIIKTRPDAVDRLKKATLTHGTRPDYKTWLVAEFGVANLIDKQQRAESELKTHKLELSKIKQVDKKNKETLKQLTEKVETLEKELEEAKNKPPVTVTVRVPQTDPEQARLHQQEIAKYKQELETSKFEMDGLQSTNDTLRQEIAHLKQAQIPQRSESSQQHPQNSRSSTGAISTEVFQKPPANLGVVTDENTPPSSPHKGRSRSSSLPPPISPMKLVPSKSKPKENGFVRGFKSLFN